ncbi:AAA family ATPase [Amycolatopsis sp. H20-H5]|uniref:AAA family ATPase n=1 Tax=Amycolatopsis sp. H20-H5 TaxID=3046309 RepID=UPI002DB71A19|nr:AAA family ATPase [Amycolatopsis sp. H20-H5]MEC3981797.1 AAA family ATPase [Amycolatopsis sp. H20-H5]
MRVIGPSDPLQIERLQRIAVAGPPGAGKSTLARRLCEQLGLPFAEFESFYHAPGWTVRPTWQDDVRTFLESQAWAIEWQGEEVREHMTARAQVLVWLDHPRTFAVTRVIIRTVKRRLGRGPTIAGGNSEGPLRTIFTDPNHIIKDSWRRHPVMRARVRRIIAENRPPNLVIVRLRGQRQVDAWLRGPFKTTIETHQPS